MQSLNRNGVSITRTPGEEKFVKYRSGAFRRRIFYQYDYHNTEGSCFRQWLKRWQSAAAGVTNG